MIPAFLLPERAVRQDGEGERVALESGAGKALTITLGITRIVECESLEVTVCGSTDGESWEPVLSFPPKSYCGVYTAAMDVPRAAADLRFLRAHWKMHRWDLDRAHPVFDFYILAEPQLARVAGAV
jgi:hypothetical protein